MTQMDVLVTNVAELLAGAVHEVLRLMGQAVSEYREESARIHQENQKLQRTLEELQAKLQISDAVQQVSSSVAAEEPLYESRLENLSDCNLEPRMREKNLVSEPYSRFMEEKPITLQPGTEIQPPNLPKSPTYDFSQTRRRFLNPRSKSASPVITEAPDPLARIKTESKSELPECSVTEQSERDRRPYSPLHHDPTSASWDPTPPPRTHARTLEDVTDASLPFRAAVRRDCPHGCHVCGKSFATAYSLGAHFVCHTGERPYACSRCKFRFSRLADLKKHERIHTGERPYNCSLCGRRFNRTENLRRHLKKVHHGTLV
ncbi:B-cell CLL/lymphoma 6 member B protein [Trichomycterus rosablanca]|uniref:B-cell CLL/lymphoma 6 member B protein n=1 Tax=Trichomycterus rosablanca TaxID=2290929 RepID=UPI002F35A52D